MIEIRNLSFSYKEDSPLVLKDVNMNIEEGKWISILGHNGSGKSTLAKILVGLLLDVNKGEVIIDDIRLDEDTIDSLRQRIGIVFQNPDNQFVGVTVKHDIAFGLENRLVKREDMEVLIAKALEQIDMQKYSDKEPHNLSGGQKQRVAIGGVIACDLKYIIFDEATSMLDPKGSNDVINLIKDLKEKQQKTIITITHDLDLANLSDYVYVLKKGEIVCEGTPKEVFLQEDLIESSNLIAPFKTRLYHQVMKDNKLKQDKELTSLLCKLDSTM